jgi:ABC-type multidrug transport system fused ATPase/permease subunit
VAHSQPNSFQRVYPRKELFQGAARASAIWSSFASVALCLLLFDFYLITDLLDARGRLFLSEQQAVELALLTAEAVDVSERKNNPVTITPPRRFDDSGLLPSVWRFRHKAWGPALAAAYRNVDWLQQNGRALILLILAAAGLGFVRSLLLSRAGMHSTRAGLDVVTRLRRALHRQTLRLGPGDLEDTEYTHVLSLFSEEMERVRNGISLWVHRLGRNPLELVLLLALSVSIHWLVALQCLIPLMFCWYLVRRQVQRCDLARKLAQSRANSEMRLLSEGFRKPRIVRGYGMEAFEHEQFQKHLDRFRDNVLAGQQAGRWSRRTGRMLVAACGAIVLFLLGSKVLQTPDDLSLAGAGLLVVTFACMHRPLQELWQLHRVRDDASVGGDRIYRYLDQIPDVSQAVGAKFLQPLSKTLNFEAVTYSLPHKKLLDGLDLKLRAGESVAIVSIDPLESRALMYMLPRFIEPQSGRILIDGEDIAWVTLESLRAETIYVGGADPFFTGSVLQNISCGNSDFLFQDVTEAAKKTHAHNFILRLNQGYETILGEHGEQLDAGQAFRLGLARAVSRNPALMIIDEPDDALDADAKSLLDDAYNRITRDRTVLFLPTRLSTLRRADRIVVIHRGRVEAIGPYSHLVKESPLYRHWEYVRFNEFCHELEPEPVK